MGLFRPDRRAQADPMVGHRMALFALGAIVALAGIASGTDWIIYLAVGILAVGLVLRLAHRRNDSQDPPPS